MDFWFSDDLIVVPIATINLAIAALNVFLAIKIWQLKQIIARITKTIVNCELYLHYLLLVTPPVVFRGQQNIHHFRYRYQLLQLRLQQIGQLIWLLSWLYRLRKGSIRSITND
jgi:hypothetical protein